MQVNIRNLMEAGAHFGHQTHRWNPKMSPYIFTSRAGVHIINLDETLSLLKKACAAITDIVASGGEILFVGTKRQCQAVLSENAEACDMPYVIYRWLGGMLTNFDTIRSSIDRLTKTEGILGSEETSAEHTKKELMRMTKDLAKLKRNLGGIIQMNKLPGALFVVDPKTERIAVLEAKRLNIPVFAVTDSNCNPDLVDYVIPGNDDAIKSIELFAGAVKEACLEGRRHFEAHARKAEAEKQAAEKAKADEKREASETASEKKGS